MALQDDGYKTTVVFTADATVLFEEKSVTPPSVSGGGEKEVTTMKNTTYRTRMPKKLITIGPMEMVVAYDPGTWTEIIALCNNNDLVTITWPDGATLAFYGYLDEFTPSENVEGEQPEATIVIIPTLKHKTTLAETAPVYTAPI